VAIRFHDANILLRDGLAPSKSTNGKFRIDFGVGVAKLRRHYAKRFETFKVLRGSNARMRLAIRNTLNERISASERHAPFASRLTNLSQVVKENLGAPYSKIRQGCFI